MEEPDLSFINVDINLGQIKPLGTKKIVAFVNYFLTKNVQMLNRFVSDIERRIADMEKRMSRIEVELKLLELKLDSVPGLQMVPSSTNEPTKQSPEVPLFNSNAETNTLKGELEGNAKVVDSNSLAATESSVGVERLQELIPPETAAPEPSRCCLIRDDPRYVIYFKMLKMGVPPSAVKQKMTSEGVNASILDTPDAPSDLPENAAVTIEDKGSTSADDDQDSTSSFSDA